jgi:hypothetical protein
MASAVGGAAARVASISTREVGNAVAADSVRSDGDLTGVKRVAALGRRYAFHTAPWTWTANEVGKESFGFRWSTSAGVGVDGPRNHCDYAESASIDPRSVTCCAMRSIEASV